MKRLIAMPLLLAVGLLNSSLIAADLDIGSDAPSLDGAVWVKGEAFDPAKNEDKQVTVVEFWATWCGPCIMSIPHLTEIAHEFADKGVRVVGVTRKDPRNKLSTVKRFVKKQGDAMDYSIAFDEEGDIAKSYMEASGSMGIPTAFIVDQTGTIAWIGSPFEGLDETLKLIVDGKYDAKKIKEFRSLDKKIEDAYMSGDFEKTVARIDELLEKNPARISSRLMKFDLLARQLNQGKKAKKWALVSFKALKHDADATSEFAQGILSEEDKVGSNKLAVSAMRKAYKKEPNNLDVTMAYFRALVLTNKRKKSLQIAERTVELLKGDSEKLCKFARVMSEPATRKRCGDLALHAVELAIAVDPEEPAHYISKFFILHECKNDQAGAIDAGQYALQLAVDDAQTLNDFAWELMNKETTKGQFNELALAATKLLIKTSEGDTATSLDTYALALFENGKVDDAIRVLKQAIEKAPGNMVSELRETLRRFEDAN